MHVHRVEPIDGESPTNAGLSFTLMMMMTTRRDWGENWVTLLTSPIHASPYGIDTLGQNLCWTCLSVFIPIYYVISRNVSENFSVFKDESFLREKIAKLCHVEYEFKMLILAKILPQCGSLLGWNAHYVLFITMVSHLLHNAYSRVKVWKKGIVNSMSGFLIIWWVSSCIFSNLCKSQIFSLVCKKWNSKWSGSLDYLYTY